MGLFAPSRILRGLLVASLAVAGSACGGGGSMTPPPGSTTTSGSSSAFVFFGDAPPPGSTILKFEITLSGAILCPQVGSAGECQGTPQPSLITQPVQIEVNQLELESAFLNLSSVPAGTYAGVKLTFANPELKLLLSDGTVVKLEPPALQLNPAMVTPTFPGGLMVDANTNFGFLIDFNVFDSIQSSGNTVTGISPMVTLVKLPAVANQEIEELEDVTGKISNLNKTCPTGTFTLTDSNTQIPINNIHFDATTEFEDLTCATLDNNQTVEVDLKLQAGATLQSAQFFAKKIEMVNPPNEMELEGMIFQVNSPTQFVLLVQEEAGVPNVPSGSFVTVSFDPATVRFRIDANNLPIPSALTFASGNDLLAGQKVEVDVVNGTLVVPAGATCGAIADNCTALAEKLKLKRGSLTARVSTPGNPNFIVDQLPSVFGSASNTRRISADCQACFVSEIQVDTSSQTEFQGVANASGLSTGNIVTVRGLLFKGGFGGPAPGSGRPEMVAQRVRRRTP